MPSIPGYRLNDPALPPSPLSAQEFADLRGSLLFGEDDVAALKQAEGVVADQVEAILDVWYGFVGGTPHLLRYFSDAATASRSAPISTRCASASANGSSIRAGPRTIAPGSPGRTKLAAVIIAAART